MSQSHCEGNGGRCDCLRLVVMNPGDQLGSRSMCQSCGHSAGQHDLSTYINRFNPYDDAQNRPASTEKLGLQLSRLPTPDWMKGPESACGSDWTPREETVVKLAAHWERHRIVHMRATPSSGKSTLSMLLEAYLKDKYPPPMGNIIRSQRYNRYKHIGGVLALRKVLKDFEVDVHPMQADGVWLIMDEAQSTYGDTELWDFIAKDLTSHPTGIRIMIIAAIGSSGDFADPLHTPMILEPQLRMCMRPTERFPVGVYLDRSECYDMVKRFGLNRSKSLVDAFEVTPDVNLWIWSLSAGHCGVVKTLLRSFHEEKPGSRAIKKRGIITLDDTFEQYGTADRIFTRIQGFSCLRGIPDRVEFTKPEFVQLISTVLVHKKVRIRRDEMPTLKSDNAALFNAFLTGLLYQDADGPVHMKFCFPTPLHRLYTENMLLRDQTIDVADALKAYPDGLAIFLAILRKFSKQALNQLVLSRPDGIPLEAGYQAEFYRAAFLLLNAVILVSEWTGSSGFGTGRVDFFLGFGRNIVFELLREGMGIEEHLGRFQDGGRYHGWVQQKEIRNYLCINFCTHPNCAKISQDSALINVTFTGAFTLCTVTDHNNTLIKRINLL